MTAAGSGWRVGSFVLACALAAVADPPEPASTAPAPEKTETDPVTNTEAAPSDQSPSPAGHDAFATSKETVETHIAQLRELHAAMKKELSLSSEQADAVDGLFAAHIRTLSEAAGRRPFGTNPDDAKAVEELRGKLTAAREAGDQEAVQTLTAEFRQLIESRRNATGITTDQFYAKVIAVLDKDQTAAFRKLIKKLRVADAKSGPTTNLNRFWRAVLQPEVNLTQEQRQAIHKLRSKEAVLTQEARANGREAELPAVGEAIRAELMDQLTAEQREKVDALMNGPARPVRPTDVP